MIDKDIVVIPKATSEAHLRSNLDVFDFTLDDEDIAKIDAMGSDDRLIVPPFQEFDKEDVYPND